MHIRTLVSLAAAALFLPACSPTAAPATGTPADEQAIRDMAPKYAAAFSKHDAKAVAALVADDYEEVEPTGAHNTGPAEIEKSMSAQFAMMPAGTSVTMTATTTFLKWVDSKTAVVAGTWQTSPVMAGMPSKGSWLAVAVKKDSTWKMLSSLGAADVTPMAPDTTKAKPKAH